MRVSTKRAEVELSDAVAGRICVEANAVAGRFALSQMELPVELSRSIMVPLYERLLYSTVLAEVAPRAMPSPSQEDIVPGVRPDDVVSGATVNGVIAVAVVHIRTGVVTQDY